MASATFFVHTGLEAFLPRARRGTSFTSELARAATLKNAIEAIGIPHTEVAAVRVNGVLATLARIVRSDDAIEVFGWTDTGAIQPIPHFYFVADAHLGALARYLRMLGFDTLHSDTIADSDIRLLAAEQHRVVLTRDRELLKCTDVLAGCYVRALKPEQQLREVASRFDLARHARAFTRCLRCNTLLAPVDKHSVVALLPESVARAHETFYRCGGCARVYWPGSHHARMQEALQRMLP